MDARTPYHIPAGRTAKHLLGKRAVKGQRMPEGGGPSGDCEFGSPASPRKPSPGLGDRVGVRKLFLQMDR